MTGLSQNTRGWAKEGVALSEQELEAEYYSWAFFQSKKPKNKKPKNTKPKNKKPKN